MSRSTGSVPSFAPAASPRVRRRHSSWPPRRPLHTTRESPTTVWACTAPRPISARFEPVYLLRGVRRWFLTYTFPSRLPDPDHLAVPARPGVVRAAPTLPGVSRLRLPQLHRPAATGRRRRSPTSIRTNTAPRGAQRARSRPWTGPRRSCRYDPACPRRRPTTTSGTARRRCSPPWRAPLARSSTPATPGTGTRSSSPSSSRSPRPTRGSSCTSSSTTTPPTCVLKAKW